jgi:TetR/AcrR family transcriptional repressor of nem operon
MMVDNCAAITTHGCPVGRLCAELGKLGHAAHGDASRVFTLFRSWLRRQFEELGASAEADAMAMHLLAQSGSSHAGPGFP